MLPEESEYEADTDFVLLFRNEDQNKASILNTYSDEFLSSMVTFYPYIEDLSSK